LQDPTEEDDTVGLPFVAFHKGSEVAGNEVVALLYIIKAIKIKFTK
jgi:hypothetical protein